MVVGGKGNHAPAGSAIFPPSDNMTSAGMAVPLTSEPSCHVMFVAWPSQLHTCPVQAGTCCAMQRSWDTAIHFQVCLPLPCALHLSTQCSCRKGATVPCSSWAITQPCLWLKRALLQPWPLCRIHLMPHARFAAAAL